MYTTAWCGYCDRARALLRQRGLGDTVRVIESSYEFHGGFRLRTLAQRA